MWCVSSVLAKTNAVADAMPALLSIGNLNYLLILVAVRLPMRHVFQECREGNPLQSGIAKSGHVGGSVRQWQVKTRHIPAGPLIW